VCDVFDALVTSGYATARPCGHHRARLFHIHHKPRYRAVGEPNNRHRRPTTLPRAVERLMLLDAVLADRDRSWLATEQDKVAYFTLAHRIPRRDLPSSPPARRMPRPSGTSQTSCRSHSMRTAARMCFSTS
jgi:hypothetical protein